MTPREVDLLFTRLAFEAGLSLFRAYDVPIWPSDLDTDHRNPEVTLISVIGFTGRQLSGSLVLGATVEPLEQSKPHNGASASDWIAELANQLLGRIKNQALRRGIEFYAVPPSVVNGKHLRIATSKDDFRPLVFVAGGGLVCLWIELCTSPELHPDAAIAESGAMGEGEMVLF